MVIRYGENQRFTVTDRDEFREYIRENCEDPAVIFESWGPNSVPETLVVKESNEDEREEYPYYRIVNTHPNGVESTIYLYHNIIDGLDGAGIIEENVE